MAKKFAPVFHRDAKIKNIYANIWKNKKKMKNVIKKKRATLVMGFFDVFSWWFSVFRWMEFPAKGAKFLAMKKSQLLGNGVGNISRELVGPIVDL